MKASGNKHAVPSTDPLEQLARYELAYAFEPVLQHRRRTERGRGLLERPAATRSATSARATTNRSIPTARSTSTSPTCSSDHDDRCAAPKRGPSRRDSPYRPLFHRPYQNPPTQSPRLPLAVEPSRRLSPTAYPPTVVPCAGVVNVKRVNADRPTQPAVPSLPPARPRARTFQRQIHVSSSYLPRING